MPIYIHISQENEGVVMSDNLASIKLVPIGIEDISERQICMSNRLIKRLGINPKQKLHVCFGKRISKVKVTEIANVPHDEIHLNEKFLNELSRVFHHHKFLVKYIQATEMLYIGPIIGLVTEIPAIHEDQEPNFGSIHTFCKELNQFVTNAGGFFYVFHYQDFSAESVNGYYFDDNKWVSANLPLPDVVYNRIHSRRSEQTRLFTTFRNVLEQFSIPMFNDRFLSKWEVYQQLIQEDSIHPFMPETRLLSQENFYEFIEKYESIFIKPVHGSQGRNIMKLVKEDEHIIIQTSKTPQQNHPIKEYFKNDVFYRLKPYLHNRIYIIQQGIPLINFEDKTMDFRILVHKNQRNLWDVTSLVARISAEQQFVSNLAKGGKIMKPLVVLTSFFKKDTAVQLIALMKELAIHAAEIISRNTNGITGELGIDIGIDDSGMPWIIEVNSKPSKNFEDSLTKIRPSAKAIIQFCTKLALDGVLEMEE
jgi:glutathione synthase/RimK-type ligase-like ATP-grasp enzyme